MSGHSLRGRLAPPGHSVSEFLAEDRAEVTPLPAGDAAMTSPNYRLPCRASRRGTRFTQKPASSHPVTLRYPPARHPQYTDPERRDRRARHPAGSSGVCLRTMLPPERRSLLHDNDQTALHQSRSWQRPAGVRQEGQAAGVGPVPSPGCKELSRGRTPS